MPLKVTELFGYSPASEAIRESIRNKDCPFVEGQCRKFFGNGMPSGLCSASQSKDPTPVICCPQRLYANDYEVLKRVAAEAFGAAVPFMTGNWTLPSNEESVIPFGQKMGKELKVAARGSNYSFDWILALVTPEGELKEFVAVEIQTIDTTGNYQLQSWEIQQASESPHLEAFSKPPISKASNFNFENVNKRILPQLIMKCQLLRLESLCKKGLFFVCPTSVLERIIRRLGGELKRLPPQPSAITFHDYSLDMESEVQPFPLKFGTSLTTTMEEISSRFSGIGGLPDMDTYTKIVQQAVKARIEAQGKK